MRIQLRVKLKNLHPTVANARETRDETEKIKKIREKIRVVAPAPNNRTSFSLGKTRRDEEKGMKRPFVTARDVLHQFLNKKVPEMVFPGKYAVFYIKKFYNLTQRQQPRRSLRNSSNQMTTGYQKTRFHDGA